MSSNAIRAWRRIVPDVRALVRGLAPRDLDRRRDGAPLSVREFVHHIAEANVVAASIVVAALGNPGVVYDWSWMQPFGPWFDRMGYAKRPIRPSLDAIVAVNAWVSAHLAALRDGLSRPVFLLDETGQDPRKTTVRAVLEDEARHVREHIDELRLARSREKRAKRGR